MSQSTGYTGHGANTGGLQAHSTGPLMPFMIQSVGLPDSRQFQVLDSRTGNTGRMHRTYHEAEMEVFSLRLRNLMHS